MRRILYTVWDFLTYRSYRVKIKTYNNDTTEYIPQVKVRCLPFWWSYTGGNSVYCDTTLSYENEITAWEWIDQRKEYLNMIKKRTESVEYKYEEQ